ncbi:SMI1/KNR4 family protein [Streptomyces sp. NBC_00316]|uniref:SMI1/KNR4 family protein n=1 Tax=Streptomyces sp. NBC_00316 TaxID=2975710 RepID=UPI002E2CED06|nr:SMI1/KNR4 family protein [Streptomyces sp. NBC_00316]
MAEQDPGRRRFAAGHHGYRLRSPLTEQRVQALEREYGVRLPGSYRSFLTDVADGGAGPHYGVLGLTEELDEADAVHGTREESRLAGFLSVPFPHTRAWPGPGRAGSAGYSVQGSLVIAEQGCGMFSRLVVTGESAGQVWCDDPDWGGLSPGPDFYDWYTAWLDEAG